jgi:hypothetical protein
LLTILDERYTLVSSWRQLTMLSPPQSAHPPDGATIRIQLANSCSFLVWK